MWQKGGKGDGGCSTQNLLLWWEIRQVWKYDLCAREHWKFDQLYLPPSFLVFIVVTTTERQGGAVEEQPSFAVLFTK